ncbi:MAG: hypothetical protein DMD64_15395 [Gemmatimonadetes bacterium]|nr:MAG: hypothetical protein DMD64_15395 [Gemmatimonadota bacterium]
MRSPWILVLVAGCASPKTDSVDWRVIGGDPGNTRYSALNQIDTTNVAQLRVAWVYHTGDLPPDGHGEIQATPIVVDGVLYTTTPALAVVALRAENGTLIWRFDPRTTTHGFFPRESGRRVLGRGQRAAHPLYGGPPAVRARRAQRPADPVIRRLRLGRSQRRLVA